MFFSPLFVNLTEKKVNKFNNRMEDDAGSNEGVDSFGQNRNFKFTACNSGTQNDKKMAIHIKIQVSR